MKLRVDETASLHVGYARAQIYSLFARNFIRAHYNFCASKMAVARGGKRLALEHRFRESEEWLGKAIVVANRLKFEPIPILAISIDVSSPTPLAGRLVKLINDYDQLYIAISGAAFRGSITNDVRNKTLLKASSKVMAIHTICVPDSECYDVGGSLLDTTRQ